MLGRHEDEPVGFQGWAMTDGNAPPILASSAGDSRFGDDPAQLPKTPSIRQVVSLAFLNSPPKLSFTFLTFDSNPVSMP
jgi:hypothetical protein